MPLKTLHRFSQAAFDFFQDPQVKRIGRRLLPYRLLLIVPAHLLLFAASYVASVLFVYGHVFGQVLLETAHRTLLPLIVIRLAVFHRYALFEGHWRFVSMEDLVKIIRAVIISTMAFIMLGLVWDPLAVPVRIYALEVILCIVLVSGVRFLARNFRETVMRVKPLAGMDRIVLAGPLDHVQALAKEFLSDPEGRYLPVAMIDPERTFVGDHFRVNDIPVFPTTEIPFRAKPFRGLKAIVICWPGATRSRIDKLVRTLEPLQVPFKIVPRMEEILAEKVSISDLREVEIEDLLERPPVQTNLDAIRGTIHGRAVLVTGGGGSIGSELCRQIAEFEPSVLVVVERSENSLMDLILELRRRFPALALRPFVASINDAVGLAQLMSAQRVQAVFHAAAYKHVPLMEEAPVESAYNNILGTYNTAQAAIAAGVRRFVMVSTDKAVNPSNVMGVTKRIAEMVVQSLNGTANTRFMTVRFGNVLGSAGSVIPIFKRQIAAGGPVTVTHRDMERFFMTIPEAVQLILQAAAMGVGGEVFVLDMGRPMKILHLAEKLITLSGRRPYEEIDIVFTEVRPGEKLYEELFDSCEACRPTAHPRILAAQCPSADAALMEKQIAEIRARIGSRDEHGLRAIFKRMVPGYQSAPAAPPPAHHAAPAGIEEPPAPDPAEVLPVRIAAESFVLKP